jgi:enoyl-CoA hydratase
MSYKFETLLVEKKGKILTLTMNRPDKLNAINATMHRELSLVFDQIGDDPEVEVVIFTGAGRAFAAGGDTQLMQDMIDEPAMFRRTTREAKRIIMSILELEKPVIAKLNGHAVGLGATMALHCDIIFASDKAKIGDPHVSVGLVAGDGGSAIWPYLIGFARAKEYLFTGDLIMAQQAADMGLINHCVPLDELDARVDAFANKLADGPIRAISWTKMAVNAPLRALASQNLDTSLALEGLSSRTNDHQEAVRAFNEKRPPKFSGT